MVLHCGVSDHSKSTASTFSSVFSCGRKENCNNAIPRIERLSIDENGADNSFDDIGNCNSIVVGMMAQDNLALLRREDFASMESEDEIGLNPIPLLQTHRNTSNILSLEAQSNKSPPMIPILRNLKTSWKKEEEQLSLYRMKMNASLLQSMNISLAADNNKSIETSSETSDVTRREYRNKLVTSLQKEKKSFVKWNGHTPQVVTLNTKYRGRSPSSKRTNEKLELICLSSPSSVINNDVATVSLSSNGRCAMEKNTRPPLYKRT